MKAQRKYFASIADVTARKTGADPKARAMTTAHRLDSEETLRVLLRGTSNEVQWGTPIIRGSS